MSERHNTRQRELILSALKECGTHITADELIDIIKGSDQKVGRATVYRHLKQLEIDGKIKKYTLGEKNCCCYQYIAPDSHCGEHYHLMCESCGKLEHIESDVIKSFAEKARQSYGFEIDEGKTVFYGLCKDCSRKED